MELSDSIALIALIFSFMSFAVSVTTVILEEQYRRKTLKLGCKIIERYHDSNIAIVIVNRGLSMATIDDIVVKKEFETRKNLITFMPPNIGQKWKGFSFEIIGRDILPNSEVVLCAIAPMNDDIRKRVLEALLDIEIEIKYHNIYDQEFFVKKKLTYVRYFLDNNEYRAE